MHLGHKPPGRPSAEAATAKQLLPKSSPKQLGSSFLLFVGNEGAADAASHAPLKRPIPIKLCECCSLAMKGKGGFLLLFSAPQTENISLLSPYDRKIKINCISPYRFQLRFLSQGLRLGQSLLKCCI